jgi:hypothetical protein
VNNAPGKAGAVLAAGEQVFVVSPYRWSFAHHPRARTFASLEAAVTSVMAMQAGKRRYACDNDGFLIFTCSAHGNNI